MIDTFMEVAEVLAKRSTCDRGHVGAVIVNPQNLIVATGYNGALPGMEHCRHQWWKELENKEMLELGPGGRRTVYDPHLGSNGRCINAEHAERNAIVHAGAATAAHGSLFSTVEPCAVCARMVVTAHLKKVYFKHAYKSQSYAERAYVVNLFLQSDIEYVQIRDDGTRRRIRSIEDIE